MELAKYVLPWIIPVSVLIVVILGRRRGLSAGVITLWAIPQFIAPLLALILFYFLGKPPEANEILPNKGWRWAHGVIPLVVLIIELFITRYSKADLELGWIYYILLLAFQMSVGFGLGIAAGLSGRRWAIVLSYIVSLGTLILFLPLL